MYFWQLSDNQKRIWFFVGTPKDWNNSDRFPKD